MFTRSSVDTFMTILGLDTEYHLSDADQSSDPSRQFIILYLYNRAGKPFVAVWIKGDSEVHYYDKEDLPDDAACTKAVNDRLEAHGLESYPDNEPIMVRSFA